MVNIKDQTHGPIRPSVDVDSVDALGQAQQRMFLRWDPIKDLLGGTVRMRSVERKWLPQEENESDPAYRVRLNRSFLFPALEETIAKVVSKPFSKSVTFSNGKLPAELQHLENNIDLEGMSFDSFAEMSFEDNTTYGLTFCFVDYPSVDGVRTLADVEREGLKPYFTMISAQNFLGATFVIRKNGSRALTSIRYMYTMSASDGLYGEKDVRMVREFFSPPFDVDNDSYADEDGTWRTWREDPESKEKWVPDASGTHSYPGIPLAVGYTNQSGWLEAVPPFEKLAWKNIEHWQKSSDHNHILRFSRFGILFGSGFEEEEIDAGIVIGPARVIASNNPSADLKYVDSSGSVGAIKVGVEDLNKIEQQMEMLGMEPFLRPSNTIKATGQVMNDSKNNAIINDWIRKHEKFLRECIEIAGRWIGVEVDQKLRVNIFSDFSISINSTDDMREIGEARRRKDIDRTTYIEEGIRRGMFADSVDPEVVAERLQDEQEELALMFGGDLGGSDESPNSEDLSES